jgi:hypothetical protein
MQITSEQAAFVATFTGAASGEAIAKCIMVHDLTKGTWRHTAALDTLTAISLGKSANESGDALEVFAYGIVLEPKTADAYGAIGQTAANQSGFVVDLSRVTSTNFAFSPTISAALTVGSNGSTSGGNGSTSGGSSRARRPGRTRQAGRGSTPRPGAIRCPTPRCRRTSPWTGRTCRSASRRRPSIRRASRWATPPAPRS